MNINTIGISQSKEDAAATLIQKGWKKHKTHRAFKKIETCSQINILKQSQENIRKLRSDVCFKIENNGSNIKKSLALTLEEERFFNFFCELSFTFTHGTSPSYVDSIQNSQRIYSYDELEKRKPGIKGITDFLDIQTGNTDFVYGVLGTEGSKYPNLLGCKPDLFIFKLRRFLDNSCTVRLSDWNWYQTDRELDPCLLGSTLRRVVHANPYKTYIYEHQNGKIDRFIVKMGEEEFLGEASIPGLALIMIKELRMVQRGDPQFYKNFFSLFSHEDDPKDFENLELKKQATLNLFHLLYSPESSIPCHIEIGQENRDYTLSRGLSTKAKVIKELHDEIKKGHLEFVKRLINSDSSLIDARENDQGNTPLVEAIIQERHEIVSYLLSKGADTELKIAPSRLNALMYAILQNEPEMVRMILQTNGVNVNAMTCPEKETTIHPWKRYHNALSLASQVGNPEIIDLLTQAGARPRHHHLVIPVPTFTNGEGIRYFLVGKKCYRDGYKLKAYGDFVLPGCLKNEADGDLKEAAIRNLKFLTSIDTSTLIKEGKVSAFSLYSYKKESDDKSIEHQVDFVLIDFKEMDEFSLSPQSTDHLVNLCWATREELEYGLRDSNAKIMEYVESPEKLDAKTLDFLIYRDTEEVNLLHAAIRRGDTQEALRSLDENHVDIEGKIDVYNARGYQGRFTPLMTAVFVGNKQAVKKLLKRGADPTIKIEGRTIFELVLTEFQEMLSLFIQHTPKKFAISYDQIKKLLELNKQDDLIKIVKNKKFDILGFQKLNETDLSFFLREENFNFLVKVIKSKRKDLEGFIFDMSCLAASQNHVKVLDEIINLGKPKKFINHPSIYPSNNPLAEACKFNQTETAILLIKNGFGKIGSPDKNKKLPHDYALENNNQQIMDELKKHSLFYTIFNRYGIMPTEIGKHWISFSNEEDQLKFNDQLFLKGYDYSLEGNFIRLPLEELKSFIKGE